MGRRSKNEFMLALPWTDRIRKELDLLACKGRDLDRIDTVCLALGPYRNLTTLSAAVLFLHPHCQVLNHGGVRIFGDRRLDFLADYSDRRFETFLRYAIHISRSGRRGDYGGSILHSHAFDQDRAITRSCNSDHERLKKDIRCLFWKESLRTSNHLRSCGVDLDQLFARNSRLRFFLPVRNPLDCAASHLNTKHVNLFEGLNKGSSQEKIVEAILEELLWVEDLRVQHPDRFFVFFEHGFDRETVIAMARFLKLEPQVDWCRQVLDAFQIKSGYSHPAELLDCYRRQVEAKFSRHPSFAGNLLRFVGPVG
jgi:hypothetical protein